MVPQLVTLPNFSHIGHTVNTVKLLRVNGKETSGHGLENVTCVHSHIFEYFTLWYFWLFLYFQRWYHHCFVWTSKMKIGQKVHKIGIVCLVQIWKADKRDHLSKSIFDKLCQSCLAINSKVSLHWIITQWIIARMSNGKIPHFKSKGMVRQSLSGREGTNLADTSFLCSQHRQCFRVFYQKQWNR